MDQIKVFGSVGSRASRLEAPELWVIVGLFEAVKQQEVGMSVEEQKDIDRDELAKKLRIAAASCADKIPEISGTSARLDLAQAAQTLTHASMSAESGWKAL